MIKTLSNFPNYSLHFRNRSFPLLLPSSLICFICQKSIVTKFKAWFGIISWNDNLLLLVIFWRRRDRYFAVGLQVITNIFILWFLSGFNWQITFWETASFFPLPLSFERFFVQFLSNRQNILYDGKPASEITVIKPKTFKCYVIEERKEFVGKEISSGKILSIMKKHFLRTCSDSRITEEVMLDGFIFLN